MNYKTTRQLNTDDNDNNTQTRQRWQLVITMLKLDFKVYNIRIQNCTALLIWRTALKEYCEITEHEHYISCYEKTKNAFKFKAVSIEMQN